MLAIYIIVGVVAMVAGVLLTALVGHSMSKTERVRARAAIEAERLRSDLLIKSEQDKAVAALQAAREKAQAALDAEKEKNQLALNAERDKAEAAIANERNKSEKMLQALQQQLNDEREQLRQSNAKGLDDMLKPVKDQFDAFRKSVEENSALNRQHKTELEARFDSTLRLFQQQQEQMVKKLTDETARIGNDANNLAQALKGNSKKQGNWGEMILKTILENSGLVEGEEFEVQTGVTDAEGRRFIPDVVVKFPDNRRVIIDSKVSLTAYTQSFEVDDEERRLDLLKAHLASVEKHVSELSAKNYPRNVENAMEFVLMFIPNESSYITAMQQNPNLLLDAYNKKVVIVSPNNLMMALQLVHMMWQNDRQIKNVAEIVRRGQMLYEKAVGFQQSFIEIGEYIAKTQEKFNTASGQLASGKGNLINQCDQLRSLGITSKKRLILPDPDDSTPSTDA